jgi:predicted nucleotidyltransferase
MAVSVQSLEERRLVQARRASLERELARWLLLLIAHERSDKIILFGSYCTGEVKEWSDLDIVIVTETQARFMDHTRQVLALLKPKWGWMCWCTRRTGSTANASDGRLVVSATCGPDGGT